MKLLITGADGMLARAVAAVSAEGGDEVVALGLDELDITDGAAVERCIGAQRPDVVFQGAAYTAVDLAESESDLAFLVNAEGARNVARACQKVGCLFVYPSTDYVFDGKAGQPYRPTDRTNPLNEYGRSKRAGELAALESGRALVVRTSWLYGSGGRHFVGTIRRLAAEREVLEVVDDQIGRPTWTVSLARTVRALLNAGAVGTFHASDGGGPVSWAGFAREIVRGVSDPPEIRPVATQRLPGAAERPRWSVLDLSETERTIGHSLADWKESLACFLSRPAPDGSTGEPR